MKSKFCFISTTWHYGKLTKEEMVQQNAENYFDILLHHVQIELSRKQASNQEELEIETCWVGQWKV